MIRRAKAPERTPPVHTWRADTWWIDQAAEIFGGCQEPSMIPSLPQ